MLLDRSPTPARPCAQVLALMVAANGRIDDRELQALDRLDAYRRLGVTRDELVGMARGCLDTLGAGLGQLSRIDARRGAYIDGLLDAVREPRERLVVARLGAAAIVADGRITNDERMVYARVLMTWHITQNMVS
ncbi:MAG TPA: hypothetical protein VFZ93_08965, partial [Albitalea sp.]